MAKPAAKKLPKADESAPDVERGDIVYFRTAKGPGVGKVLARGAHGVTLDHEGVRVQCKWADIHGHKSKVMPSAKVVDQGEDGMIVEDHHGQRRYLHDPMRPESEEKPLAKSYTPIALFFSRSEDLAKAIKNAPGLTLVNVTDKRGHQTRRWKKHGDPVTFKHPVHGEETEGTIHGTPGKDGAHVRDRATGEVHQVENHHIKDAPAPPSGAGGDGPPPAAASGDDKGKPYEGIRRKPGATETHDHRGAPWKIKEDDQGELDTLQDTNTKDAHKKGMHGITDPLNEEGLSEKSIMKYTTWEELEPHLEEAQRQLHAVISSAAEAVGATEVGNVNKDTDVDGVTWGLGPIKERAKADAKVQKKYVGKGAHARLGDMVRASMAFETVEEMKQAVDKLKASGLKLAAMPDNKFTSPTPVGYRDINLNVMLPNGVVGELQLHLKDILRAKNEGHKYCDAWDDLREDAKKGDLTPQEQKRLTLTAQKQQRLYGEAMGKALKK